MNSYQSDIQPVISRQALNELKLPLAALPAGRESGITLEAVSPDIFANGITATTVQVGWHSTPLGSVFVAVTARGISRIDFTHPDHPRLPLQRFQQAWPLANIVHDQKATQDAAVSIGQVSAPSKQLKVYVPATQFQSAVWRALLQIPAGSVVSYSQLAAAVGRPRASRAVGNAVGANPVACLIPCHRVVQQSGALGNYRWGSDTKQAILSWENRHAEPMGGC